ncbi:ATPase, T2SS/T4P/T4SS family [Oscillospiraceae bacterium PP1C4]
MEEDEKYNSAVDTLSERVRRILLRVPQNIKASTTEIRLRAGKPLGIISSSRVLFVDHDGGVTMQPTQQAFTMTKTDMQDCFVSICGWAVHSHQREMTDGYISVRGGHRAGIAATAVMEDGKMTAVRDITSINLRVAREIFGSANQLIHRYLTDRLRGLLLIGAPASGKTTLLRDLARQLSSGQTGRYIKICVVDESGEIGAASGGLIQNDLGLCCDLLSGYSKAKGLQIAIRYLSPQLIICDEICTESEIDAIEMAANSGVAVVTSIHAGSFDEFSRKPQAKRLLQTGAFEYLVLLEGAERPSQISEVKRTGELCLSY